MNTINGTMLGLAIAMGGWACSAQETTIPFRQLERDAQLSVRLTVSDNETASSLSSSSLSPGVFAAARSAAGFVRVPPVTIPRTLSSKFFLFNGLHLGMASFDVAMTQRCIASHTCREGNPLMPSSLAGKLGVNFALVGSSAFASYRMKKHRNNLWWISPATGVAAHSVGAATGIAHQ